MWTRAPEVSARRKIQGYYATMKDVWEVWAPKAQGKQLHDGHKEGKKKKKPSISTWT
jgi:hypothetical protein